MVLVKSSEQYIECNMQIYFSIHNEELLLLTCVGILMTK